MPAVLRVAGAALALCAAGALLLLHGGSPGVLTALVTAAPSPRVRREIRSLPEPERAAFFRALWVLKRTDTATGVKRYGAAYLSYDDLTRKHMHAAMDPHGDTAHLGPGFATYHRAFTLLFENALLAVAAHHRWPLTALPYWDYNVDAAMERPRDSVIWTDTYFGPSFGNPANGSAVDTGPYAHWGVPAGPNAHGLLRSPWNLNPHPGLTRHNTSCGTATVFGRNAWDRCAAAPNFLLWYACIDPGLHTWAHSFVGGIWHAEPKERIPCFLENAVLVPSLWVKGCITCPSACSDGAPCECREATDLPVGTKILCAPTRLALPTALYGDFADAWTSPNDPIFFPHHANVDRAFMRWQRRHAHLAPLYGFPSIRGPLPPGHALDDVVGPEDPFSAGAVFGAASDLNAEHLLTNADILRGSEPGSAPYTYDTLD